MEVEYFIDIFWFELVYNVVPVFHFLLVFCLLLLFIVESEIVKPSTIIVELFIFPSHSVSFCFLFFRGGKQQTVSSSLELIESAGLCLGCPSSTVTWKFSKIVIWGNHGACFICFLSLKDHSPLPDILNIGKCCFIYFV